MGISIGGQPTTTYTPTIVAYTGDLTVPSATATIKVPTKYYDPTDMYNPATGVFTVQAGKAGKYLILFSGLIDVTGVRVIIEHKLNGGGNVRVADFSSAGYGNMGVNLLYTLAVGDTIEFTGYTGGAVRTLYMCHLTFVKLSD